MSIKNIITKLCLFIKKHHVKILLLLILVVELYLLLKYFKGLRFLKDDFDYASTAFGVYSGRMDFSLVTGLRQLRFSVILPVALIFKVFGINNLTAILWPIICSLAGTLMVFMISKHLFNNTVGLLSALFICVIPARTYCGTWLLPDNMFIFLIPLFVYLFIKAEDTKESYPSILYYLGSFVAIVLCFYTRINAYIVFYFLAGYFLYKRSMKKELFVSLAAFAVFTLLIYVLFKDSLLINNKIANVLSESKKVGLYEAVGFNFRNFLWLKLYFNNVTHNKFYILLPIASLYLIVKRDKKAYPILIWFFAFYIYLEFLLSSDIIRDLRKSMILIPPMVIVLSRALWLLWAHKSKRVYITRGLSVIIILFLTANSINHIKTKYTKNHYFTKKVEEVYNITKKYPEYKIYSDNYLLARKLNFFNKNDMFLPLFSKNTDSLSFRKVLVLPKGMSTDVNTELEDRSIIILSSPGSRTINSYKYGSYRFASHWTQEEKQFIRESLPLLNKTSHGFEIYALEKLNMLKHISDSSFMKAEKQYDNGKYDESYHNYRKCKYFDMNSTLDWEYIDNKLQAIMKNDYQVAGDIALLSAGTTIGGSSPFFSKSSHHDPSVTIDGDNSKKWYYAAAKPDTLPNWFILNLNQERIIGEFEIEWLSNELRGLDWTIECLHENEWQTVIEETNWEGDEHAVYYQKLSVPVKATKVKITLTKAMGQNRLLMKRFSINKMYPINNASAY